MDYQYQTVHLTPCNIYHIVILFPGDADCKCIYFVSKCYVISYLLLFGCLLTLSLCSGCFQVEILYYTHLLETPLPFITRDD